LIGKWYGSQESADNAADFGYDAAYEFRSDGVFIFVGIDNILGYTATANTITLFVLDPSSLEGQKGDIYAPAGYTISGTVLTITGDPNKTGLVSGSYYKPRR